MEKDEKFMLAIALLALGYFVYTRNVAHANSSTSYGASLANVPWYLTYNAPPVNPGSTYFGVQNQLTNGINTAQEPCVSCAQYGAGFSSQY